MMIKKILAFAIVLLGACTQSEHATVSPPLSSFKEFTAQIVPILEKRCALSCHGVDQNNYEKFMQEAVNKEAFYFPIDSVTGKIPRDERTLQHAYHTTRGWHDSVEKATRINYREAAQFSPLLRVPLAEEFGGLPHRGMDIFFSPSDPDYQQIKQWVSTEISEHPLSAQVLPKEVQFFKENVLGVMVRNSCFLSSCHGPQAFNDLKLVPPLPVGPNENFLTGFSQHMVLQNRQQMLGTVTRFANLGGEVKLSRFLVKNLPINQGGVHQRGGNEQFFESYEDQDVKTLIKWLELEKEALGQKLRTHEHVIPMEKIGAIQGLVFIRGPKHSPHRFFNFEEFWPGSDIYLLKLTPGETLQTTQNTPINLTLPFHSGQEVEIQALDVRYDGQAIVFAMRADKNRGFRLYELKLNERSEVEPDSFRQVSFATERLKEGALIHHLDPLYMPGPLDEQGIKLDEVAITYASNEAGNYAASEPFGLLGEADGGDEQTLIDNERTEAPGTFTSQRIYFVAGPGKGEWRKIVRHEPLERVGARLILDRPLGFKPDLNTVYVIEKSEASNLPAYDIWRFVPSSQEQAQAAFEQSRAQITFTSAQERRPTLRTSGEIMFTSVRNVGYQADRPVFNGAIYRVQAGGFDYHIHGGNRSRYPLYADSRELPSGLEIRVALDPRNYWGGGLLILADHGLGVNAEPHNPVDNLPFLGSPSENFVYASSPRYLPAQLPLAPETGPAAVTVTGVSPGGAFRDPFPLPDGSLLTAQVSTSINHLDPQADPNWDIALINFAKALQSEDGQTVGAHHIEKIQAVSTSQWAEYSPRPLMIRLKENPHPHQKFTQFAQSLGPQPVHGILRVPPTTPAEIVVFDYPLLQAFLTHFAPIGARNFHEGDLDPSGQPTDEDHQYRYVRIIMQVPPTQTELVPTQVAEGGDTFATPISLGIHTRKLIVAEIPLAPDGSLYAQVPPQVPLILQGLNRHKMALHSMNRWFYVHPGEKLTFSIPRSIFPMRCAGCHGALTGKDTDGIGPVDMVSAASRVIANWDPFLQKEKAPFLANKLSPETFISVDFRKDIQTILDKKCVTCHAAAPLDLRDTPTQHYTVAYENLHQLRDPAGGDYANKKYINEREALAIESPLIEKLLGHAFQGNSHELKPHPEENFLTEEELLILIRWIDLGATFKGGKT